MPIVKDSVGKELIVEALGTSIDLSPVTKEVLSDEDQTGNASRVLSENFERISDSIREVGGPNADIRDVPKFFGGLYMEGFISSVLTDPVTTIPHNLGRRPRVVMASGNLDGNGGLVFAVTPNETWTAEVVTLQSTVTGNYFIILV